MLHLLSPTLLHHPHSPHKSKFKRSPHENACITLRLLMRRRLGSTNLVAGGQRLEPVVLLVFVGQRGRQREVLVFGLFDRDGIGRLEEKKDWCQFYKCGRAEFRRRGRAHIDPQSEPPYFHKRQKVSTKSNMVGCVNAARWILFPHVGSTSRLFGMRRGQT